MISKWNDIWWFHNDIKKSDDIQNEMTFEMTFKIKLEIWHEMTLKKWRQEMKMSYFDEHF